MWWCNVVGSIAICVIPPQRRYPDRPPRRVQISTRNEICLAANEILLRKVKSVCDGWLHCVQVVLT
ncbi:MAG TPA: hypothetical protein DHU79_06575 [Clostridiales bacterium]|nr:hypothetical protein [Clostridiales bacterium]